jgi:hypothetical protein
MPMQTFLQKYNKFRYCRLLEAIIAYADQGQYFFVQYKGKFN